MFWADKIAADSKGAQVVNDSKTPSGRVHVGSLRGVVIHDVIYRALKHAQRPVKFLYGVDDYDALDTVPHYLDRQQFSPYLGHPLCNVPAPEDTASDYAKYFMGEFLQVFDYLGVRPEIYYLRDFYRSGQLNSYIETFLNNAQIVREVYRDVSKAERPDDWYPFQVVCENCGKIATTTVSDYNGSQVFYTCKPDATDWVAGCGHSGWVSPFDGRGKLPWKVEWVAKWDLLGVTIELAGKDHSQKGGSRDVANGICRRVLRKQPPFHSPYEFILVNGTKMSSSKGVGSSAKEIAELLPADLLRFLMLRTRPKTVINFAPNYETTTRLFRDYDNLIHKHQNLEPDAQGNTQGNTALPESVMPLLYSQLDEQIKPYIPVDLSTLISLLQIPHLDINQEVEKRSTQPLTDYDRKIAQQRIQVAQKWLADYADEEEKLVIYLEQIPDQAKTLSPEQRAYCQRLIGNLAKLEDWQGETLQTTLFATAKELEMPQPMAFQAIYLSFLGKERGPKAGSLLSYLEREFVIARLREISSPS
jgi:lysyl-tRNA synthetase class 1